MQDGGVVRLHVKEGYFFTLPKQVASPIWGPPPSYKQALKTSTLERTVRNDKEMFNKKFELIFAWLTIIQEHINTVQQYRILFAYNKHSMEFAKLKLPFAFQITNNTIYKLETLTNRGIFCMSMLTKTW